MIQLAIIHPQPLYRQGLHLLLRQFEDLKMMAATGSLRELIQEHPSAVLDVILWELPSHHVLPPGIKVIRETYPLAKVLALADARNGVYAGLLVNLGAAAVAGPQITGAQLHRAIRELHQSYAPPPSSNHVQEPPASEGHGVHLSIRELDVLQLICQGFSGRKIGERLQISKRTVDGHRLQLRRKLEVKNAASMVRVALERQLVPFKINQI